MRHSKGIKKHSHHANKTQNRRPKRELDKRETVREDETLNEPEVSIRSLLNPYWSFKFAH